ncbi:MAG: DUF4102 domain-containing protein [Clostridia bacterium]|nr:DUF4102 domain-containing protein [Clostridia bacterium]
MLTDKAVKAAAAREKRYTIGDGNGLVLDVRPGGQKYWIARTWEDGKEKKKVLGRYPDMSLKAAREANILHRRGSKEPTSITFSALAEEWMDRRLEVSEGHLRTVMLRMEKYILPALGSRPLDEITPMEVLAACRAAEDSGFLETAHRVRGIIGQVFRYGVASGRCAQNPAEPLRGALKPAKETSYPTLTQKAQIQALVAGIEAYPQPVMRAALKFSLTLRNCVNGFFS